MDLGSAFFTRIAVPSPPELDARPRAGALAPGEAVARCDRAFEELGVPAARRQHLKALALLYHDHLDASHEISQRLADRDGSYVHALMHRREGDSDNARYWFRRVGAHPAFPALAARAQALGWDEGATWNPERFVEAVRMSLANQPRDESQAWRRDRRLLLAVQDAEFRVLAAHLVVGG